MSGKKYIVDMPMGGSIKAGGKHHIGGDTVELEPVDAARLIARGAIVPFVKPKPSVAVEVPVEAVAPDTIAEPVAEPVADAPAKPATKRIKRTRKSPGEKK